MPCCQVSEGHAGSELCARARVLAPHDRVHVVAYDRGNGDAAHKPNPCIGPIGKAPFYAVRVEPTPLGTSLGLRTDVNARVCNAEGATIPGLYAVGNDMHSVMGGEYPGAGAQLGPGMTFGYLAARHAVSLEM